MGEESIMRERFGRVMVVVALGLLALLLASCGGGGGSGGGGGDTPEPSPYSVWIVSPTSGGAYQTESDSVSLSGGAFAPSGSNCPGLIGTMPSGYQMNVYNAANGMSAYIGFYLGCLLQVNVIWETAPIPLVLGSNTITVTATDPAGNTAQDTIVVTRVPETTPPTVVSTSPVAGATDVPVTASVTVTFSEAMDAATLNASTFTLKNSLNAPVAASVSYDVASRQARLTPSSQMAYGTGYVATVGTGARDASGNALAASHVFSFTTAASNDFAAPGVQSVSPAAGSACAATSGAVTASFDEDLDPATVTSASFGLTGPGGGAVPGVVAYINRTASFTPVTALSSGSAYTAGLTTAITDLSGNPLAAPYQWAFATSSGSVVGGWLPTSLSGPPSARYGHAAAWTGSQMVVVGGIAWDPGLNQYVFSSQYGRYNPATETWTLAGGAPAGWYRSVVWTGSRLLLWGGSNAGGMIATGSRYDPDADTWTAMATSGQPAPRAFHTAVWTGSEMIVWGGWSNGVPFGDGAIYNPATDTWRAMSSSNAPSPRSSHTAVWTGTEMIVWGGVGPTSSLLADGARYNPSTDTWTPISAVGAPSPRIGHVAAWSGARMFVWGEINGNTNTGGLYDPATDSWTATDALCAPSGRRPENVVWTGSRMIIWGGATPGGSLGDGYEYDPLGNAWTKIAATGAPAPRSDHTAVWTGSKVIIWGGWNNGTELNTGGVLAP
jgi:N-acetylneuraminic acid mutarotase